MANEGNRRSAHGFALDRVAVRVRQDLDLFRSVRVDRDRLVSDYVDRNHIANCGGGQVQCDGTVSPAVVDEGAADALRRKRRARGVGDNPGPATWGGNGGSGHLDWP